MTRGKTDASLLKQLGVWKLATRRKLSTDHPDKAQVGLDEPLPGQASLIFEQSQFLLGRIGKAVPDSRASLASRPASIMCCS